MRFIQPLLILLIVIAISCNKDKFTTIPQVKIKSTSPDIVRSGDIVSVKGEYTDKEGDLDTALIIYKWYNGANAVKHDTFVRLPFSKFDLPPKTTQGEFSIDFEYNTNNTGLRILTAPNVRDTTGALGIILIDKKGNRSEYAESKLIRLIKP